MHQDYSAHHEIPSIDDYLRLRRIAGLTPRSVEAAQAGLPKTAAGVVIRKNDQAVGMGRVVGDGLFYQVVDIAVDPAHQRQGLGKAVMAALMRQLDQLAPAEVYVSLIADGEAHLLYAQFGFVPTAPASIGMAQWVKRARE
jgi:ribosomal protein S18 acetylase RimI-like enzyme